MRPEFGTYALILRSDARTRVQIGRWRPIDVEPGYYVYVGSAFGPGGVRARVLRHCRGAKVKHWHIDFLREFAHPLGAWYSHEPEHLEHRWAQILYDIPGFSPVQGFGCSDCRCFSHLYHTVATPDVALFSSIAGGGVQTWGYRCKG